MTHIVVQADDLSGAAETAHCFVRRGLRTVLVLTDTGTAGTPVRHPHEAEADAVVHDTHSRGLPAAEAQHRAEAVFRSIRPGRDTLVFKKTDSLWRGNIRAEIAALTTAGHHVVVAGALPHLGRAVLDGRSVVDGVPLGATDLWRAETAPPPADLRALLRPDAPDRVHHLPLAHLRSAARPSYLSEGLAGPDPVVLLVDGETDADLDLVVDVLLDHGFRAGGRRVVLAGTGAAAAALADRCALPDLGDSENAHNTQEEQVRMPAGTGNTRSSGTPPVLAVVGSASRQAQRQLRELSERGFLTIRVPVTDPPGRDPALLLCRTALAEGSDVVVTTAETGVDPARSALVVASLARFAARVATGPVPPDLLLTGGETAREVLTALGHHLLVPLRAVEHGTVLSRAEDGTLVGTKPGSFGGDLALADLHDLLRQTRTPDPSTTRTTTSVYTLEQS